MKNSRKNIILAVVLSFLTSVQFSYAQSLDDSASLKEISDFKLNSETESSQVLESSSKSNYFENEYNLSLGSQMLSYQNTSKVFPSEAEHIETGFVGLNLNKDLNDSFSKSGNQKDFTSVITLNSSYEDNAIGFGDSSSNLSLSGKSGRLSFYGEYNQSNLSIGSGNPQSTNNNVVSTSRASISNTPGANISPDDSVNPTAISSDYYLEAVYSFKPTLKGKVAFKKTVIDTFDLKENVEVEGIVEASSDVSIKAGYSNESRPEVEKKPSKEQKVWTEFILKF
ncbi:MAG: hypothetical protein J6Z11_06960 [Candidatus Riflebacteria bacterium]|nr:hypothetical protein [Candidatus Riflebacteria bacterium]